MGSSGLAAMLGETEVLVNLLPLTHETHGILNSELFARMRRGGYLVQVGAASTLSRRICWRRWKAASSKGPRSTYSRRAVGAGASVLAASEIVITPHDAGEVSVRPSQPRSSRPPTRYEPAGGHRTPSTAHAAIEHLHRISGVKSVTRLTPRIRSTGCARHRRPGSARRELAAEHWGLPVMAQRLDSEARSEFPAANAVTVATMF